MSTIILLIAAALVLVFFEVIVPGGILGIIAGICVIVATGIAGAQYGAVTALWVFIVSLTVIGLLTYIEFKILSRSSSRKHMILDASLAGHPDKRVANSSVINKEGHSITRLNPSGKVIIDGQSFQAQSQDGYIESGQPVRVVGQDSFKLIIKKL